MRRNRPDSVLELHRERLGFALGFVERHHRDTRRVVRVLEVRVELLPEVRPCQLRGLQLRLRSEHRRQHGRDHRRREKPTGSSHLRHRIPLRHQQSGRWPVLRPPSLSHHSPFGHRLLGDRRVCHWLRLCERETAPEALAQPVAHTRSPHDTEITNLLIRLPIHVR